MNLLIKFPSRERPKRFFEVLNRAQRNRESKDTHFLITLDSNDGNMNNDHVRKTLELWGNLKYKYGVSKSKVDAVNRDMEIAKEWDIVLLLSDDMYVNTPGYDRIICEHFEKHFPDTDGILWINDGYGGKMERDAKGDVDLSKGINTIVCMGKKYYERFGFIYNPVYLSLFCDNEYTSLAVAEKRFHYIDEVLIEHRHPMNSPMYRTFQDNLYRKNDRHYQQDMKTYNDRKKMVA